MGRWRDSEKKLLFELYPSGSTEKIAQQLGRSIQGVQKMAQFLTIRKEKDFEGSSRLKPGSLPPGRKSIGSTRVDKLGYLYIKVREGERRFTLLHYEVWKTHHGAYPPPGYVLCFRDGDKKNCDIDNLECVSKADFIKRYSVNDYPAQLLEVIRLRGRIVQLVNRRTNKNVD